MTADLTYWPVGDVGQSQRPPVGKPTLSLNSISHKFFKFFNEVKTILNWSVNFVKSNGIRLHYHHTNGNKPPLLLAHGLTDDSLCWIRAAQVWEKDYELIMLDARGHGRSDAPQTGYSVHDHAADLVGVIEALSLDEPILIAQSMSASSAAVLAGEYPKLVSCLILEDPPWRTGTIETTQERETRMAKWQQQTIKNRAKTREEIIDFARKWYPTWDEIEYGPWADAKQRVSPHAFEFILTERSWEEAIPKIACPTLLITANPERGAVLTPEVTQQIIGMNPLIQATRIEGAGHDIRREQFVAYMEAVQAFLQPVHEKK